MANGSLDNLPAESAALASETRFKILESESRGEKACIVRHMPLWLEQTLEDKGFKIEKEYEDDNYYWVINW